MSLTKTLVRKSLLSMGVDADTVEAFILWHNKNPGVYPEFRTRALTAIAFKRKFGAKAIMEVLRWESEIVRGEDWKVNNSYTAYFARVFITEFPEHQGYFEFREVKGLKKEAA